MNDQTRVRQGHRLTEAAGMGTGPVPMEPYRSLAFYEQERERSNQGVGFIY